MLKRWSFWKPILQMLGFGMFLLLITMLPKELAVFAFGLIALAFFASGLYQLGKASYNIEQIKIKQNYKNLTGKDWEEDK